MVTRWVTLEGLGQVPGVPAGDLAGGDEVLWSRGSRMLVIGSMPVDGGRIEIVFSGSLMAPVVREFDPGHLLAGVRGGRWIGLELVAGSPLLVVCRVRVAFRRRYEPCGELVDLAARQCPRGHSPSDDQLGFLPAEP